MKMKYLVVGAAIAGFAGHTANAQPACCAASVTNALREVDGVRNVQISFEQKGGTVEFDAAKVTEAKIMDAINKSGFKARRVATEKS